jgi:hypothetical protein
LPQLEVPNRYLALAPVIVSAPTPRCGTTIVQRLLSASSNAFLYGEEVGHHIRTLTNFMVGLINQFDQIGAASDEDFRRALAGELTDWRPGLMPPVSVMMKGWVETFYQLPLALAEHGAAIGRPIWGFKGPDYTRDQLRAFLMLLPRARVVYVFRHLAEALKSAKARRFAVTDEEVAAYCARWAANMREVVELRTDARLLFLRYEDLATDEAAILRLLENFTGAQGIDPTVLRVKVNTYAGDAAQGHSPTQYIAPAELTAADEAAIRQHAGPILDQLYPAG